MIQSEQEFILEREEIEREEHKVYLFLIDDPSITSSTVVLEDKFSFQFSAKFPYKEKVAYVVKLGEKQNYAIRQSDTYTEVFLENGELSYLTYFCDRGFTDVIMEEERIISNGTYYKLMELGNISPQG